MASTKYSETPPTPADAKMRVKHASASVDYNMRHAQDHLNAIPEHLTGLQAQNPAQATSQAHKVVGGLQGMMNQVSKFTKGTNMQTTQKTGSFQGKSNAPGGGGRAAQLKAKGLSGGLIGFIGRKKFGAKTMAKWSAAGRAKKSA